MIQFIPNALTPIPPASFYTALLYAWTQMNTSARQPAPSHNAVLTVMAQSALETGWWKFCHCFNFGNAKSVEGDGFDYTFFACNEDLPLPVALRLAAASAPAEPCKISSQDDHNAVIWFYPDHPGCRFRAFTDIDAGMSNYLQMLMKRFSKSWSAACAGDPRLFVKALKAQGYFTAPEKPYEDSVAEIFEELQKMGL